LAPLLVAFLLVELRRERPAVDPRLLAQRPFAAAVLGVFGATIVLHGTFLVVPMLVEIVLEQSPATSGSVLLGVAAVSALVAPFGGRLSDRRGRRALAVAGGLVMALGVAGLATPVGAGSVVLIALLLGVVGLGFGLAGSPRQAAAFESIERSRLGMAAGTYYTGRYLGGVVGASVAGAIVGSTVTAEGVELTFAVLAVAAVGVAIASLGLRAAPAGGRPAAAGGHAPTAA
ncbi:MAG TPA: MFS transporter, partial [Candidatus Deferrimicrobiaceae bacterium]|nr:MFS transporter [Candidatus Deferrimicrobiaceae bacterium]